MALPWRLPAPRFERRKIMRPILQDRRLAALLLTVLLCGSSAEAARKPLTPVVLFPAFHFTQLKVLVKNQTAFPECPASGTFEDWFLNDRKSSFSQVCRDELLALVYDPDPSKPIRRTSPTTRSSSGRPCPASVSSSRKTPASTTSASRAIRRSSRACSRT
jgi:hypothetical protein